MIKGQVVHKRTPGKNLLFLDIIEEGKQTRASVLFKDQNILEQVKRGDKKVHLGDTLRVEGSFDGNIFLATSFTIIQAWKDKFPRKTFQAIPPNFSSKQSQVGNLFELFQDFTNLNVKTHIHSVGIPDEYPLN